MKKIIIAAALLAIIIWPKDKAPAETITREVNAGDTVYAIAADVATPKDDINYLSWKIMRDNGIEDPGSLQPGTVLTIRKGDQP
jgi:hypothetical protein